MLKKKLKLNAKRVNAFIKNYISSQKKSILVSPMNYGVLSGGKKIRSSIILSLGKIYNIKISKLINICGAVECIHSYSLIHDDLPCMDNDTIRRGKPSTHVKFGESTAVLAGNSLLTMAFEILSHKDLKISEKIKINLINKISESTGHLGVAGGQYLDLSYEHKKISKKNIIEMEIKKTGKLFSFCCMAPAVIANKNQNVINFFQKLGSDIGLLFQITDDFIDDSGETKKVGKKTKKDKKKGKATLISLLGHRNTVKYVDKLKFKIFNKLKKYGTKSNNINETINYILKRKK